MVDLTSRMTALLAAFRRERNGAVADSMRFYGASSGLNYGVSLPTLRSLARAEAPDYQLACFLWKQQVRELRLAALHIAPPSCITPDEFDFWGRGLLNSETAEEAAFALFSRIEFLSQLVAAWLRPDVGWLCQYTALMSAARCGAPDEKWMEAALSVLREAVDRLTAATGQGGAVGCAQIRENGTSPAVLSDAEALHELASQAHLLAQGVVCLFTTLGQSSDAGRRGVFRAVASLGDTDAENYVREELAWRLEN